MTLKTTFITLNDGTQICAPADTNLMTNFVLNEQGDWFEDEIHFVRKFIQPDMMTLDIGANYGLYSTAIAKKLGKNGKLWCFEPTQNTANALRQTISKNKLDESIELIQSGLSDHIGQATFYTSSNAELNSLTENASTNGQKQTIELLTLDHCLEQYQWERLDFIKLDAEGEEINILKGAEKTLSNCSPLIMFELKHGDEVNLPLITAFKNMGYRSFYLVPGLGILIPLDMSKPLDAYQLNLFCCKDDTAGKLAEGGLLIQNPKETKENLNWPNTDFFTSLPFSKDCTLSAPPPNDDASKRYQQTFAAYAYSRDLSLGTEERFDALNAAFEGVKTILSKGESKIDRLSTLARISYDIGHRTIGNQILNYITQQYFDKSKPIIINEAFVPPCLDFETTPSNGRISEWLSASILEQYIKMHALSCYFSGPKATAPHFKMIRGLNFMSPKMEKCLKTIQERSEQA